MDSDGWLQLLRGIEDGSARALAAPSPLAAEALDARPYAFLDDAPLEERRTQAVHSRRYQDPDSAEDLGRLDPAAIAAVCEEAWPQPHSRDEMHEALAALGALADEEVAAQAQWTTWLAELAADARATRLGGIDADGAALWVAAESLALVAPLYP